MASYWANRKEIRLHPYLEVEGVPDYYLKFLLYHELCHAQLVMSGQAKDGEHHGPDFRALEKILNDQRSQSLGKRTFKQLSRAM